MATKLKINIQDNSELRKEIDEVYENMSQVNTAKWSLSIAKHILEMVDIDYETVDEISEGFKANELWQIEKASMHHVRQAAFKIHKLAREANSQIKEASLRVVGQAVSSGHMKEHAMVASDYAIKTVGLINEGSLEAITRERQWQLNEVKRFL